MGAITSLFFKSSDSDSDLSNDDQISARYLDDENNGTVSFPTPFSYRRTLRPTLYHMSNHTEMPMRYPDNINNGHNIPLPSYAQLDESMDQVQLSPLSNANRLNGQSSDSANRFSNYGQMPDDSDDEVAVQLPSWARSYDSINMAQLSQQSLINRLTSQNDDSDSDLYSSNNDHRPTEYPDDLSDDMSDDEVQPLHSLAPADMARLSRISLMVSRRNGQESSELMRRRLPGNNPYIFHFSQPITTARADNNTEEQNVESSTNDCFICCRRKRNAGLMHRGNTVHQICCVPCGLKLKKLMHPCPVCRAPIKRVVRIYVS